MHSLETGGWTTESPCTPLPPCHRPSLFHQLLFSGKSLPLQEPGKDEAALGIAAELFNCTPCRGRDATVWSTFWPIETALGTPLDWDTTGATHRVGGREMSPWSRCKWEELTVCQHLEIFHRRGRGLLLVRDDRVQVLEDKQGVPHVRQKPGPRGLRYGWQLAWGLGFSLKNTLRQIWRSRQHPWWCAHHRFRTFPPFLENVSLKVRLYHISQEECPSTPMDIFFWH